VVHIVAATTATSCGQYDNTASLLATNEPGFDSNQASTSVLCPNLSVTKVADDGTHDELVNQGDPIGFTITVANAGPGEAHDVKLNDGLPPGPTGAQITWVVDSVTPAEDAGNCAITTDAQSGQQALACTFASLGADESVTVHITSDGPTTAADCGDYPNQAILTASNDGAIHMDEATVSVVCVLDTLNVVADAPSVSVGQHIGFTITGKNVTQPPTAETPSARTVAARHSAVAALDSSTAGPGTVVNAVMVSALPAGAHWSIKPSYGGQGTCAIAGPNGSQILTCQVGDLAPQASFSVHIRSNTSCASTGSYLDKGTLSSANVSDVSDSDSTRVKPAGCAGVPPVSPPPPHHQQQGVTASTGIPMLGLEITWGVALVVFGGLLAIAARRRRSGVIE
jgi:uncharacterized repeat protein (TIGR01451 family)